MSTLPELGLAHAGQQGNERRFSAARWAFEHHAIAASRIRRFAPRSTGSDAVAVAEDQVAGLDYCRCGVLGSGRQSRDPGSSWRVAARNRTEVRCHATAAPANCQAPAASRLHAR